MSDIALAEKLLRAFHDAPLFGDKVITLRVDGEIHRMAQKIVHEAQLKNRSATIARVMIPY
jgi:hypothetical protein